MRDRNFLERYLPTNFEYDNYKITINVSIHNTEKVHTVFTNGDTTKNGNNSFLISYPENFNSSSLYFHIGPKKMFKVLKTKYKSIKV